MQKAIYLLFYTSILKQQPPQICVLILNRRKCLLYLMFCLFSSGIKYKRNFNSKKLHTLKQLTSLNYFSEGRLKFIDFEIIKQLKDIVIDVSKRKCKSTMGQMFCIECALVKKNIDWFNKNYRTQYLEVNAFVKMQYERNNLVNWKNDKCILCKLPLRVEPTMPDYEMTYGDFIICFEHKFIRNIYIISQIKESDHLETLGNYYEIYQNLYQCSIILIKMMK